MSNSNVEHQNHHPWHQHFSASGCVPILTWQDQDQVVFQIKYEPDSGWVEVVGHQVGNCFSCRSRDLDCVLNAFSTFLECVFLNVFLTFLQCVFLNVFSTFLQCVFLKWLFDFSPVCLFKCLFDFSTWIAVKIVFLISALPLYMPLSISHACILYTACLHLFACLFICVFMLVDFSLFSMHAFSFS